MVLEVRGLIKRYGRFVAVSGVGFSVARGVHGLVGPNGAGKTTTMKCIVGLAVPDAGDIVFLGESLLARGAHRLRKLMGYVAEMPVLPENYTAEELLVELAMLEGLSRSDALREARRALEEVGLWEARRLRVKAMSKGMRKRLYVAQAILQPRELYVLDEPFTGLDPEGVAELRQLATRLGRDAGVLLSSHLLREMEDLATEVTVIYRGSVVYTGSLDQLRSRIGGGVVLEVEVDDVARAAKLLASKGYKTSTYAGRVKLRLGSREEAAEAIAALVEGGVKVYSAVRRTLSLEEAYIALIVGKSSQVLSSPRAA
ncbi:ABC transporter ATP-binding protein [Hyperthermus butylicus]|uniref:ABC transporter ATP-binding protein n=1 Tax=Hyperthermus butylicus TaxID=54248 RepID=UPI00068A8EC9|nr:ABC transporter ATP-binding protein [Hyperthermus butylicus]